MFVAETWLVDARLKVFLKNLYLGNMHVVSKVNQGGWSGALMEGGYST